MYDQLEFFKSYFQNASEKQIITNKLGEKFHPAGRVLDLGCHDGALTQMIFDQYQSRINTDIELIGVDPAAAALDVFVNRNYGTSVKAKTFHGGAEDYFNNHNQYHDWIIASQSLYWAPDLSDILKKIKQSSRNSLIVLRGNRGIYEIQSTFKHLLGNKQEKLYVANDIANALSVSGIEYERENIVSYISMPDKAQEYNWVINFFLQTEGLSPENYSLVRNFIEEKFNNSILHEVSLFWIK